MWFGLLLAGAICAAVSGEPPLPYTVLPVIPKFRPIPDGQQHLFGERHNGQREASVEYGVPENALRHDTKFEPVSYEKAILLENFPTYAPHSGVSSATYGPPGQYGAPNPTGQYGAPNPTAQYGAPNPTAQSEYGAPAPSPNPGQEYGAPVQSKEQSVEYGVPSSPSPAPSQEYGPPVIELGVAPSPNPSGSYGPPSSDYGAPGVSIGPAYGAPAGPTGSQGHVAFALHHGKESPVLAELRERVLQLGLNPLLTTDKQLERYLVGFNFRVGRVIRYLTKTAIWRRTRGIDEVLKNHPADYLTTNLPYECTGYTHEGNPVMYVPLGRWNFRTALRLGSTSEIYNYMIRMLEEARSLTVGKKDPKTGWPVDQVVIIVDMQGYGLRNLVSKRINFTLLRFFKTVSRHYPFFVKKWFMPRTPLTLRGMWQVMRKFVSRRTRDNFEVYSLFSVRGPQALFHTVPKTSIPIELGGTYVPRYVPPQIEPFQLPTTFSAFGSALGSIGGGNTNYGAPNSIW